LRSREITSGSLSFKTQARNNDAWELDFMSARKKLAEARFFLGKLHSAYPDSDEFKYYVSACVWALYGSYDHLLYDYAKKFWPELDTDVYLDNKTFDLVAAATGNEKAKSFIKWYREAQSEISRNMDSSTILKVRRVEAHRGTTDYGYWMGIHDAVSASGANIVYVSDATRPTPAHIPIEEMRAITYFSDYLDNPVEKVIENTLKLLDRIVSEAEAKFGVLPEPP
jgi:hypothetical protein